MYTDVSTEYKEAVNSNAVIAIAKIYCHNADIWILPQAQETINSSLVDVKMVDPCYKDGKLIGSTCSKEVEIQIINKDNLNLEDDTISLYLGVKTGEDDYEYIPQGDFLVQEYEDTRSNDIYKIVADDFMIKCNGNYLDNEDFSPTFPTTLKDYRDELIEYLGFEFAQEEETLPNDNFVISIEPNFEGYTNRAVLGMIAELQGRFVKITRDNKISFVLQNSGDEYSTVSSEKWTFPDNTVTVNNEVLIVNEHFDTIEQSNDNYLLYEIGNIDFIDKSSMNSKLIIDEMFGPVNSVTLSLKGVEGENVTMQDNDSIALYGETNIEISDNPFVYTEALREAAITALFNTLKGFSYYPAQFNYKGRFYYDAGDTIDVQDTRTGNYYPTIVLNQTIQSPASRRSKIENKALTRSQVLNKYISGTKQANTRAEIMVDKANLRIESITQEIGDRTGKTTTITQDIDGILSQVELLADVTEEKTESGAITFEDVNTSEPLYIRLYPLDSWISYLYPANSNLPSSTLYPQQRTIRFANTTTNENIDYILPCDLRSFEDAEHGIEYTYDEFILDYENQVCKKIERIGVNSSGAYVHSQPREITYDYPRIMLTEGDYTVSVLGHTTYYFKVKINKVNDYTRQFATNVKLISTVEQTANAINLELNEKVNNEDYTAAQILLKINDDESEGQIKADKINLARKNH